MKSGEVWPKILPYASKVGRMELEKSLFPKLLKMLRFLE